MSQLFENELKVGDKVIYSGLGSDSECDIVKRTKRTITLRRPFSTVKLTFVSGVPAKDLGLRRKLQIV
ncbi:hypothetical protein [Sphingobacterium sp. 1.A.5]|uniref:hypothetical protein n=1 Tax=Sphingobacterium sp. 1.A.5 TaxID=2044604 RepID=UPI000C0BC49B|nr:hypothetical protein [Sphingobacterium sp. 1.A.5]